MVIIEYKDKYLEDIRRLLTELGEYIVSIDKDNLEQVHPDYYEKMALIDLEKVKRSNGKCYLALDNGKIIGLIMGTIREYTEDDYLDYKCPKEGVITELIVTKDTRSKGIGAALMDKLEKYFKEINCKYIIVDVFAYNEIGINFYQKYGYHNRMHAMIKEIDD